MKRKDKIIFFVWLFVKLGIVVVFARSVVGFLINRISTHPVQDDLTFLPFDDWLLGCFVFVVFSDFVNYRSVKSLQASGFFIKRLLLISICDFFVSPLAVVMMIVYNNSNFEVLMPLSYFVKLYPIWLMIILKNILFVVLTRDRNAK